MNLKEFQTMKAYETKRNKNIKSDIPVVGPGIMKQCLIWKRT